MTGTKRSNYGILGFSKYRISNLRPSRRNRRQTIGRERSTHTEQNLSYCRALLPNARIIIIMSIKITKHTVSYDEGRKQIAYLKSGPGTGPLIIFVHGWPGIALTWKPQLELFASLGFLVIAPDMPGYGRSTANKTITDYSLESIVHGLLALLAETKRKSAVWISHDWGAGVLSALVATHPEVCHAAVWMTVPYGTLEYGLQHTVQYVNREMYPEEQYPYGQWDYQAYYEESFEKANAWYEKQIPTLIKTFFRKSSPSVLGKLAHTATVRRGSGLLHGEGTLPETSLDGTILSEEIFEELVSAMESTSFFPADSYYMNHERNREYVLTQRKNDGILTMPCLFIQAKFDTVCDTVNSRLLEPMTQLCKNFSFANIDAGHWVALEKPAETNAILVKWLLQEVGDYWPGSLQNALMTVKR